MLNKGNQILVHMWYPLCCSLHNDKYNLIGRVQGKEDGIVITTIGKYLSSSMKQIFHNGQQNRDGIHNILEGMTSTAPLGTFGLITST